MNIIKKQDLEFGSKSEKKVVEVLEEYFKTILFSNPKYHTTDFSNEDFEIELKSRNNKYKTYPTTMIGQNKIAFMEKHLDKKRCIFCFQFTDGLYYIELTKELIKEKFIQNENGGREDRGKNEFKNKGYCYIPIKELTKI